MLEPDLRTRGSDQVMTDPSSALTIDPDLLEQDEKRFRQRKRQQSIILATLTFIAIAWLVSTWIQRTSLLTDIPPTFKWTMVALGACLGALVPISVLRIAHARKAQPAPAKGVTTITVIFSVFILVFAGIGWDAAWEISNVIAFAGSQAPFVHQIYPLTDYRWSRGGPMITIDPFHIGDATRLQISHIDYQRLRAVDRPREPLPLCYPAVVQREGNAVRMVKSFPSAIEKPILVPCRGY